MPVAPVQSFTHHLNPSRGWPCPFAVEHVSKQAPGQLYDLRAGQCVHLNSSGLFEAGCQLTQMPMWLFQGANEADVSNYGGTDQWVAINPRGFMMALTAKAALELETTEFVPGTYNPNDLLKSPVGLTANDEALDSNRRPTTSSSGVLRKDSITLYTTAVVGVVSRGVKQNYNKKDMLAFWPVYLPGTV